MNKNMVIFFDAGIFIGALLKQDARHQEARILIESARRGELKACTSVGIISEVYAALTWIHAQPQHSPKEAANALRICFEPPSSIQILQEQENTEIKNAGSCRKVSTDSQTNSRCQTCCHSIIEWGLSSIYV